MNLHSLSLLELFASYQIEIKDMKKPSSVPVLLILFNRPEISKQLIRSLSNTQPKKLYIYFDGPRENQKIIDSQNIDEIKTC